MVPGGCAPETQGNGLLNAVSSHFWVCDGYAPGTKNTSDPFTMAFKQAFKKDLKLFERHLKGILSIDFCDTT